LRAVAPAPAFRVDQLKIDARSRAQLSAKDNDILTSLEVGCDRHPEDITWFEHNKSFQSSERFLGMRNDQFSDRSAQPAESGTLTYSWKPSLHPLQERTPRRRLRSPNANQPMIMTTAMTRHIVDSSASVII
jgi:hypothetical protein